jgi:hypothetical protein
MFHTPDVSVFGDEPEALLAFSATADASKLQLASNCAYEVWQGDVCLGDGGPRCAPGTAYAHTWALTPGAPVRVVMHWIRTTRVTCRRTFPRAGPFLWASDGSLVWECTPVEGHATGARSCSALPNQLWYRGSDPYWDAAVVAVESAAVKAGWAVAQSPVPVLVLDVVVPKVVACNPPTKPWPADVPFVDAAVHPLPCAFEFALKNAARLRHTVFDLGGIQLYKVRISVPAGRSGCIVVPAEVATLKAISSSANRSKTKLATVVGGGTAARLFGHVGGRYLHVFEVLPAAGSPNASLRVMSATYPLKWLPCAYAAGVDGDILMAVRATAAATVDGGIVDTCWRERTQWTGDACVMLGALARMADNPEVAAHVLRQIAASYCEELGMVAAITPVPDHAALYIPAYHLLFCSTVHELLGTSKDPALKPVRDVVTASVKHWRSAYVTPGGALDVRSPDSVHQERVWHFVDWAQGVAGRGSGVGVGGGGGVGGGSSASRTQRSQAADAAMAGNCVLHGMWIRLCNDLGVEHGVDIAQMRARFMDADTETFSVLPRGPPSVHATTEALLAGAGTAETVGGLKRLVRRWMDERRVPASSPDHGGPTAYYAARVCDAMFSVGEPAFALQYARAYYGPIATKLGTLWEKKDDRASLAHSWSVGVAAHVLPTE